MRYFYFCALLVIAVSSHAERFYTTYVKSINVSNYPEVTFDLLINDSEGIGVSGIFPFCYHSTGCYLRIYENEKLVVENPTKIQRIIDDYSMVLRITYQSNVALEKPTFLKMKMDFGGFHNGEGDPEGNIYEFGPAKNGYRVNKQNYSDDDDYVNFARTQRFRCFKSTNLKNPVRLEFRFPWGQASDFSFWEGENADFIPNPAFVAYDKGKGYLWLNFESKDYDYDTGLSRSSWLQREQPTGMYTVVSDSFRAVELVYEEGDKRVVFQEALSDHGEHTCQWNKL